MDTKIKPDDFYKIKNGNEVVISGLSGNFPNSHSIYEFCENLYNKVNLVSETPRSKCDNSEIPEHTGNISSIKEFDAQFFKVGSNSGAVIGSITKNILKHAYGAIFDSGNTDVTLKRTRIGVYVGVSSDKFSTLDLSKIKQQNGLIITGLSKSITANLISYWLDSQGPSYCLDTGCASSTAALEKAYTDIKAGVCDAALVGTGNICSHENLSLRAGKLYADGKTKYFAEHGDGCVRSETYSVLFLQKAKDARRVYAEVYHIKASFGKPDAQFLPIRKSDDIGRFLSDFYSETDIEPNDIEYIEANGAAFGNVEENELVAIEKVFARDRSVKIGCVKSNIGHSGAASGLTAVTKLCIAYNKGKLPANIHTNEISGETISSGKVKVLQETTSFNRGYMAINNFSLTGVKYHVVLKGHFKQKNLAKYRSSIPHIVLASGRQESGVNKIFDWLKSKPVDEEEIALLHGIFEVDIPEHTSRGFTILDTSKEAEKKSVACYRGVRRPLWFVFSGVGSEWVGMGADLIRIPIFQKAIERCHKVLEPKGVDIIKIISGPDKTIFDNILNAFVGIGAVQIGLTDILQQMGVEPDYIIGHGIGETGCAYQDGTLSLEEAVLSLYETGKAIVETPLVEGTMAAVGLGYRQVINICPLQIDVACRNSFESSTISGPVGVMREFMADLKKRNVFVKEVPSGNIAYHSRYVADAGPALLSRLSEVIKVPKARSKKWLSTSVPRQYWDSWNANYSYPEYHTNNLLGPVLFEEMAAMIPEQAVVVEIAPHCLLQAILKRSHPRCSHIALTRSGCRDGVTFLLESIGKLYEAGYNPKVDILYPKVEFPVSTETPFLSHLVEWEHSKTRPLLEKHRSKPESTFFSRAFTVSSRADDYLAGNVIDGFIMVPESALLVHVWETIALIENNDFQNVSMEFSDVTLHSDLIVCKETDVKISVAINRRNDTFEVKQNDILKVSGTAKCVEKHNLQHYEQFPNEEFDDIMLKSTDVYQILNMRGYGYKSELQLLHSINITKNHAIVKWNNNWVSYLDSLIQLNVFLRNHNGISKPKFVRSLKIDVREIAALRSNTINGEDCFNAQVDTSLNITRSSGVEICGIIFDDQLNVIKEPSVIRDKIFFPYLATEKVNTQIALEVMIQIVFENSNKDIINMVKSLEIKEPEIFQKLQDIVDKMPNFKLKIKSILMDKNNDKIKFQLNENVTNVIICENVFGDSEVLSLVQSYITKDDFVLALEHKIPNNIEELKHNFSVVACMSDGKHILMLLRKIEKYKIVSIVPVTSLEINFSWISKVKKELVISERVVLVSENLSYSGVLGFVQKLRRDESQNLSLIAILDDDQKFDVANEFYKNQLDKNMAVNVLKKGQWGGYYSIACESSVNLRNFTLNPNTAGNIEALSWMENAPCFDKNNLVQVSFSGLSVHDCQKAMGIYRNDCSNRSFGMDFSGIDKDGDRIMGLISGGATSSSIEADPDLIWPVPVHWSLEDAATVPLPYALAYYCLTVRHKLERGQTVFVTNGPDPSSLAIISLCLASDCIVFTTVATEQQKMFLLRLFPNLKDINIIYSNEDTMHTSIFNKTERKGCNLVINTFTGKLCEAAMKCVGFLGTFLDLNTHDMHENKLLALSYLESGKNYKTVDFMSIFRSENITEKQVLQYHIADGIATGSVSPLPRAVYPPAAVVRALSRVGTSSARVLLKLRDPTIMNQGLKVTPRLTFNPEDVVIVVCDESGLGVALTDKLIERGARHIVLHMDTSRMSGYIQYMFISWSKREVCVELSSENLCARRECGALIKKAMKFGKLKAVFIVVDGNDINVRDEFTNAYNKMCSVALNFDSVTRSCASLSYLTVVCPVACSAGGQYAVSVLERAVELRRAAFKPALLIQHSLSQFDKNSINASSGLEPQTFSTFFSVLEISLKKNYQNVTAFNTKKQENINFYKTVAKILGVRDIEDLQNETTLQDLNLNGIPLKELRIAIKSAYQIDYPLQQISKFTIQCLKGLNKTKSTRLDTDSGIAAFYKQIDNEEEHLMQEPIVILPNCSMVATNPEDKLLIMIPGFEGRCNIFESLAEKLKVETIGLNLGPDFEGNTIQEIANNVRKMLHTQCETKSKFHILGYSFGVNIALELAAIFEKEGCTGNVYCLNSSPQALSSQLDTLFGKLTENELQDLILSHIYNLITNQNENIVSELESAECFEEKINKTLKMLKSRVSYSQQYMRILLESAYKRIKLAKEYKPKMKLQSELVLLKWTTQIEQRADLADDYYNLSQYSEKPLKMFEIVSSRGLSFADVKISEIINGHIKCKNYSIL